jgi:hypothetical protein
MIVATERTPRLQHDFLNKIGTVCSVPAVKVRNLEENSFVCLQETQEFVVPSSHGHLQQSLLARVNRRIVL